MCFVLYYCVYVCCQFACVVVSLILVFTIACMVRFCVSVVCKCFSSVGIVVWFVRWRCSILRLVLVCVILCSVWFSSLCLDLSRFCVWCVLLCALPSHCVYSVLLRLCIVFACVEWFLNCLYGCIHYAYFSIVCIVFINCVYGFKCGYGRLSVCVVSMWCRFAKCARVLRFSLVIRAFLVCVFVCVVSVRYTTCVCLVFIIVLVVSSVVCMAFAIVVCMGAQLPVWFGQLCCFNFYLLFFNKKCFSLFLYIVVYVCS